MTFSPNQKFKTFRRNEKGLINQMTSFDKFRVFSSKQTHFQHLSRNNTSIKRVDRQNHSRQTMSRTFRGRHENTGRTMNIHIRLDFNYAPTRLIAALSDVQETTLLALAEVLARSEPSMAKALARIIGSESFRASQDILPSQVPNCTR